MALDITNLNNAQKRAVTHGDGPVMIVAGAGTGKTTVIANRIAWLIAEGRAQPNEILAVTFTEKAAAEMEERVDKLLPLGYTDLWIHTFHGFCHRVLDEYGVDIGLPGDFRVLDQTATWLLVRQNLDRFNLDYYKPLGNSTKFIHALVNHFARCKDEGVHPADYLAHAESSKLDTDQTSDREAVTQEAARLAEIANAYHIYQRLLVENNALDFGDLIDYTVKLFKERPAILERFRKRFSYILIDEFQDTNWLQYDLIKLLAAPRNNIMVVGDDDQSIYKFRGASFSNIILFKKDYPAATEIFLTDNYRSKQNILDVAYRFIQLNNPDRLEVKLRDGSGAADQQLNKQLVAHTGAEGELTVLRFETADDEVRGVIEKILELKKSQQGFSWNDVAILVRTNETAQRFVRYLRSLNVPHQFLASKGLYSQDVIRAVLNYLRLLDNYHESDAAYAIITLPVWGIAGEDVVSLNALANQKNWSLWQTLSRYRGQVEIAEASARGIAAVEQMIAAHTVLKQTLSPSHLIYRFLESSGYLEYLTREDTQYTREQMLFLNQFYKKVRTWEEEHLGNGIKEFTEYIALELESGSSGALEQDIEEGPETIKVSTIHSAKGLEYPYVFIVGLVHLRFPTRERKDPIELPAALIKDVLPEGDAHLQEERRLMYVALTRAKEKVFLTYAQDYGGVRSKKPSRFLDELGVVFDVPVTAVSADLVMTTPTRDATVVRYRLPAKFSYTQLKTFEVCPKQYYYAHIVRIPSAGRGTFTFGKTMHAVLEKFLERVRERSAHAQGQLFSEGSKTPASDVSKLVSLKELLVFYDEVWSEDWFADAGERDAYYERGRAMLKSFYEALGDNRPTPVLLEHSFHVKIGDATLKGQIDRIDEISAMAAGGEAAASAAAWRLFDYKTGKPPKTGNRGPKDTLDFEQKEQLLLYQVAVSEVFNKPVDSLVLYFLENGKQYSFIGSEEDISRLKKWVTETIGDIRTSDFAATPSVPKCATCDFKYICPAAQLQ